VGPASGAADERASAPFVLVGLLVVTGSFTVVTLRRLQHIARRDRPQRAEAPALAPSTTGTKQRQAALH